MTHVQDTDGQLQELAFELEEIREAKFLICVCENEQKTDRLIEKLKTMLADKGKDALSIAVKLWDLRASLIQLIVTNNKENRADAIHLRSISLLTSERRDRFFAELNFQRDILAGLGVPLILWVNNRSLQHLVTKAPDFWSRRHAVYKFDSVSVDALLARMFAEQDRDSRESSTDKRLSDALSEILISENELQTCLDHRSQFSLTKADDLISRIKASLSILCKASKGKDRIEVALWLWNTNRFDEQLQQIVRREGRDNTGLYDTLYADRNEVLLRTSEQIPQLLEKYGKALERGIRTKQLVSLAKIYMDAAFGLFRKMARYALRGDLPLDELIDYGFDSYETGENEENQLRAKIASQLETWLSSEGAERPSIFSDEEASLLRALYRDRANTRGVNRKKIAELEKKVRLYLGVA